MVDFSGDIFGSTCHPAASSRLTDPRDPYISFPDNIAIIIDCHSLVVGEAGILSGNGRSLTDFDLIDSNMESCVLTMEIGRNAVKNSNRLSGFLHYSRSSRTFTNDMVGTEDTDDSVDWNLFDGDSITTLVLAKEEYCTLTIVMVVDGNMGTRTCRAVSPDADITGLKLGRKTNVLHKIQDSIGGSLIGDVFDITSLAAMNGFPSVIMLHHIGGKIPAVMMEMVVPIVQVISIKI